MQNNETLRRLAAALTLSEDHLAEIFALGGEALTSAKAFARTRDLSVEGAVACTSDQLICFLDGFILDQRGPSRNTGKPRPAVALSNNMILKKLRIALNFKEDDMLRVFEAGGTDVTPQALSPLFRKPGNKHFRACSDGLLRSFLIGLAG